MIVNTKHGEFEVKDLSRIDRRKHYRRVKEVYEEMNSLENSQQYKKMKYYWK